MRQIRRLGDLTLASEYMASHQNIRVKRNYRFLSPQAHKMIRGAIASGRSVSDMARAWDITVSHASKIGLGKVGPRRTVGAAAGAWKDYGPRCKRGHERPEVRDRKERRCKQCAALRQTVYRFLAKRGIKIRQLGHGVQAVL